MARPRGGAPGRAFALIGARARRVPGGRAVRNLAHLLQELVGARVEERPLHRGPRPLGGAAAGLEGGDGGEQALLRLPRRGVPAPAPHLEGLHVRDGVLQRPLPRPELLHERVIDDQVEAQKGPQQRAALAGLGDEDEQRLGRQGRVLVQA